LFSFCRSGKNENPGSLFFFLYFHFQFEIIENHIHRMINYVFNGIKSKKKKLSGFKFFLMIEALFLSENGIMRVPDKPIDCFKSAMGLHKRFCSLGMCQ
jgi:hypothetical protein